jgi:CheY-like chemotaxis protein
MCNNGSYLNGQLEWSLIYMYVGDVLMCYVIDVLIPRQFDFIMTDINMPKMDGLTAMERIRLFETEHHLERVHFITLTGMCIIV